MGKIFKADGAGGAPAYVRESISPTADIYFEFCVYFPSALLDDPDVQSYDYLPIIEVRSDDGPPETTFAGSLDDIFLVWDLASAWQWWWSFGTDGPVGLVESDTWYRVGYRYFDGTMFELVIDGTIYGPFDSGENSGDVNTFSIGSLAPGAGIPQAWYYDDFKAGTAGYGSSDIFADDFEGGDLSAWDFTIGAVSVIDNPTGGECGGTTANFIGVPISGGAPLDVDFSDTSSGGTATAWDWDFGDGGTSTAQNPTHTYATPGTYTVTLTATIDGSDFSRTRINYITVEVASGTIYLRGGFRSR